MKTNTWLRLGCAILLAFLMGFPFVGCSKKVERIAVDDVRDLSGRWNDTDSRLVSEEMIEDALARPWVNNFTQKKGRPPDVIVGQVWNKSHEHINVETFVKDLERALINSGRVNFVASKFERVGIREEREDMDIHASEKSRKGPGHEAGADYMIIGQINTIIDQEKKERIAFYQVELEAVDMLTNRKVWIGQKKIKKYIKSPKAFSKSPSII